MSGNSEVLQGTLDLMVLKTLDAMEFSTWLRNCQKDRTDQQRRCAARESGHHLSLPRSASWP